MNIKKTLLGKNDWKKVTLKLAKALLAGVIAYGAAIWANNPYWLLLSPALLTLDNYWNHR